MPIVTNGLKYYWNVKDGIKSGNILNNIAPSGAASNMSMMGNASYDGVADAIYLDASSGYMEVANNSVFNSSPSFTYEYIFDTKQVFGSGYYTVIGDGAYMDIDFDNNGVYWQMMQNNSTRIGYTAVTTDIDTMQRQHVVVQYDKVAQVVRGYVNGVLRLETTGVNQSYFFSRAIGEIIRFSRMVGEPALAVNFRSFRFYDRALSSIEIATNYSNGDVIGLDTIETETITTLEDFLDNTYAFPMTAGTNTWTRLSTAAPNGNMGHIASAAIGHNANSNISFAVTVPSDAITALIEVDWCVRSEAGYDFIRIIIDGATVFSESGSKQGTFSASLAAGSHTVAFRYEKDRATVSGADKGYVSDMRLVVTKPVPTDTIPPSITITSVSKQKISDETGMNTSTIKFTFSEPVVQWSARLNGVSHTTGVELGSGTNVAQGVEATLIVSWNQLSSEGANRINFYGFDGTNWTTYTP